MGVDGIKAREQGRYVGTNAEQTKQIKKTIIDQVPEQLKMCYALWTRKAVKELIVTGKITIRTTGHYLAKGVPLKRAYEQSPEKVKQWLDEPYPKIKAQAKKEQAEIYWGDETGLCSNHQRGRGLRPKVKHQRLQFQPNEHQAI